MFAKVPLGEYNKNEVISVKYITTKEAAKFWGLSDRRVRVLCSEGRIAGATKVGRTWVIPWDAQKPTRRSAIRHKPEPTKSAHSIFAKIDEKKLKLAHLRPLTAGEVARLKAEFLVEFTYNTNAIEGNTLTLKETALVLEGVTIAQKPLKDHLEAIGHRDAFEYLLQLVQDNVPLSEKVIKELHSLVLIDKPQDRGVYRSVPARIMGAVHEPPQPYLIPSQMEQLLTTYEQMKKTMHIVERIAVFHLLFEGIHPFVDGNGRTGRLLLNLELMKEGFPPINVKYAHRKRYYDCFSSYFSLGKADEMISLVAEYVEEMLDQYLALLQAKVDK